MRRSFWTEMQIHLKTLAATLLACCSAVASAHSADTVDWLFDRAAQRDVSAWNDLLKLAARPDPDALVAVGFLREHGLGTDRDVGLAVANHARACEIDGTRGCAQAAYFHEFGIGVPKDAAQAERYVRQISKDGVADVELLERRRRIVYKGLAEAEEDVEMRLPVIEYLDRFVGSASSDDRNLMERIGFGRRDVLRLARFWADQDNDPEMLQWVGTFYNRGYAGVEDKDALALKWWRRAADAGEPSSQNLLGQAYLEGRWGTDREPQQAMAWFERAAAQGDRDALMNLGEIFYLGQIVPVDYPRALALFERAMEEESSRAPRYLSWMYYNGQGVATDCPKALQYRQLQRGQRPDPADDAGFLSRCQADQRSRGTAGLSPPGLRLEHASTFHGGRDSRVACEPQFVVSTDKLGEVANLRITVTLTNDRGSTTRRTLAFSPLGLNTMKEGLDGREADPFRSSVLLPLEAEEFCAFRPDFRIESATATVNGEPVDLLKRGLLEMKAAE